MFKHFSDKTDFERKIKKRRITRDTQVHITHDQINSSKLNKETSKVKTVKLQIQALKADIKGIPLT